ncbi:MAG: Acg family FMN-binding oxidoreductase [Pseudomonadota bacterium]|uniref:Acg family FMN-binding oxidoreductase n=1 Tax=Roseovarius TaxID=74030 RepID=UPI0022A831B1|nr:Tat pathway signal protein [Roseovarius sp. EGI FJ00037]MCZ0813057.1 Tat pathway signal protein [Roseovarius sp. EGI FJ00037]
MSELSGEAGTDTFDTRVSPGYAAAVRATRAAPDRTAMGQARLDELVRLATLAPNSHNTQPWTFQVLGPDRLAIRPDARRRCPVVDPDDHHLFVSLGCVAETLAIAATGYGMDASVSWRENTDGLPCAEVTLKDTGCAASPLIQAIRSRQSTRSLYDGGLLSAEQRRALRQAAEGGATTLHLVEDAETKTQLRDLIVAANTTQLRDRDFVRELRDWIRFSEASALQSRDGLFARATGSPTLPDWIGRLIFPLVLRPAGESRKIASQIESSAALAVFISRDDTPKSWFRTGRAFQRVALAATKHGLKHAHLNQPVERSEYHSDLGRVVGACAGRPSLVIRLGRAVDMPYALRRDLHSVLDTSG